MLDEPEKVEEQGVEGGQEPTAEPTGGERDYDAEIAKLNKENAKWRTKLRETEAELKAIKPLAEKVREQEAAAQTDVEKAEARIRELEAKLQERERAIEVTNQKIRISSIASKAGLPAELVEWLDLSKFNFDDDDAELAKQLSQLAKVTKPNPSTGSANPGRGAGESDEEMRQILFGRRKSIFD